MSSTDGQTDRRTRWIQYTPPPTSLGGGIIKMWPYQYRKSHCGDKMILRPSYLHNGISYTGKITSLYSIRVQGISSQGIDLVIRKIFQFRQQKGHHIPALPTWPIMADNISRVSCQKGPICHALAWRVGPFWQDTIDLQMCFLGRIYWYFHLNFTYFFPKGPNDYKSLVQVMAWRQRSDKPLLESMMTLWTDWYCYPVLMKQHINTLRPRQMAAIFQTTFSNAFSWMKMNEFRLRFHWNLFPRVKLTIFQHWFR